MSKKIHRKNVKTFFLLFLSIMSICTIGCSSTVRAIKNKELAVEAKMSDTIFLDAEILTDDPKIFVRVANTSDFQDVDFSDLLKKSLSEQGHSIASKASGVQYQVAANLLYMGQKKEGMDTDSILKAGFGGGILGAGIAAASGSSLREAGAAGLIAGAAIAGGEALVGGIFHVDEYIGVIDIQIKEEVDGGVTGFQDAQMQNGMNTNIKTTRNIKSDKQEYRTRIVVSAKQTRMDRSEAVNVISARLASQISGLFRI